MKSSLSAHTKHLLRAGLGVAGLMLTMAGPAQVMPAGSGTNLTSVVYYDPPNEQQIKVRLSGAEMSPLPGMALYDVKRLRIENYSTNGTLLAVVEAPQCTYAQLDDVASSPGHLDLKYRGDKFHVQGEGFLWQRSIQLLVISNRQQTIIKTGTWKLPTL